MKTKFEVIVGADRDTVWQAFDNPDNIVKWQPTLKSFTHKSGPRGEVGSVAELVYEEKGREIVMTETMTEKRKPDFMAGIYESKWGKTLIVNYFESMSNVDLILLFFVRLVQFSTIVAFLAALQTTYALYSDRLTFAVLGLALGALHRCSFRSLAVCIRRQPSICSLRFR